MLISQKSFDEQFSTIFLKLYFLLFQKYLEETQIGGDLVGLITDKYMGVSDFFGGGTPGLTHTKSTPV